MVTFHRIADDTTGVITQMDVDPEGFVEQVGFLAALARWGVSDDRVGCPARLSLRTFGPIASWVRTRILAPAGRVEVVNCCTAIGIRLVPHTEPDNQESR